MNCREAREQLYPWLDEELDPELAAAVERHLAACGCCKSEADELRALDGRIQEVCRAPDCGGHAPAGLRERLSAALDAETRSGEAAAGSGRWRGLRRAAAVAAAALIATLAAIGLAPGPAAAAFAEDHARCADAAAGGKMNLTTCPIELAGQCRKTVGFEANLPDLREAGLELLGGYPCQVDGIPYMHLVYGARGCKPDDAVSVFVGRRFKGLGGVLRPSDAAPNAEGGCHGKEAFKVRRASGGNELVIVGCKGKTASLGEIVRAQVGR